MSNTVKKFIKYREKLSILTYYAASYNGDKAKEALKVIEQWKKGKIPFKKALRIIKALSKR